MKLFGFLTVLIIFGSVYQVSAQETKIKWFGHAAFSITTPKGIKAAGNKPEVHNFSSGGHGFGVKKQGTTSDHWIDEFYYWLEAQELKN